MVKYWINFIFVFLNFLVFADPLIEANIDLNTGKILFPLKGTITITHEKQAEIDIKSFKLDGVPFEASLVKNVYLTGDMVVTIYSFSLPAQPKGTYILPPISVLVDSKLYHSLPSSYDVVDSRAPPSMTAPSVLSHEPAVLKLEASVNGPHTLYLGDRTILVYRISYNRSIDLTKSELPFIHLSSFLKVGDAQINDVQQGNMTIQEISQTIEASQLGTFKIGPSSVEGRAYQINELGQKVYDSQLLHADAPSIEIVVKPFPTDNQPHSFNGALGKIQASIHMETPVSINSGDLIKLTLILSGIENLIDLHLPTLSCQPGFSGFFQINDLPPAAEIKEGTKIFHVEMRPLSTLITEVPAIELSSFDFTTREFQLARTQPIPIQIVPTQSVDSLLPIVSEPIFPTKEFLEKILNQEMPPLTLLGKPVESSQLSLLQRGWTLIIFPLGLLFLLWQFKARQRWLQHFQPKDKMSKKYLTEALQEKIEKERGIKLLEMSMQSYLTEESGHSTHKERAEILLLHLQSIQYSPNKDFDFSKLLQEAEAILAKEEKPKQS